MKLYTWRSWISVFIFYQARVLHMYMDINVHHCSPLSCLGNTTACLLPVSSTLEDPCQGSPLLSLPSAGPNFQTGQKCQGYELRFTSTSIIKQLLNYLCCTYEYSKDGTIRGTRYTVDQSSEEGLLQKSIYMSRDLKPAIPCYGTEPAIWTSLLQYFSDFQGLPSLKIHGSIKARSIVPLSVQ